MNKNQILAADERRSSMMEEIRRGLVKQFEKMIDTGKFQQGECIIMNVATKVAKLMKGEKQVTVKLRNLKNEWKCAEFVHTMTTLMPEPPAKGIAKEPPLKTTTVFKITKESAILKVGYEAIGEDGESLGEFTLYRKQRPTPTTEEAEANSDGKGKGK